MRAVGIKILKNKLSEYVRLAAQGETILVTDRDKVVAELTPPRPTRPSVVANARYADLVRRGVITPATNRAIPDPPLPAVMTLDEMLKELDASREDR